MQCSPWLVHFIARYVLHPPVNDKAKSSTQCEQLHLYACLTFYACRLSFSLMKGSYYKHYNADFHSPLRNVVLDSLSCDPRPFPWGRGRATASSLFVFAFVDVNFTFSRNWSSCRTTKSCPSGYGNLNRVNICIVLIFLVRHFSL